MAQLESTRRYVAMVACGAFVSTPAQSPKGVGLLSCESRTFPLALPLFQGGSTRICRGKMQRNSFEQKGNTEAFWSGLAPSVRETLHFL